MLDQHVLEAIASADNIEHEWDRRSLEWPINGDSVVFEIGGYKGRWALQIARKFNPWLYVFEPQQWAYSCCEEVLQHYHKAEVFNFGLGVKDELVPVSGYFTDGCKVSDNDMHRHKIQLRDAYEFISELNVPKIDLMMMNIEGYEYTLLPYLMDKNLMPDRLMVQWHINYPDKDIASLMSIRSRIEQTHNLVWGYGLTLIAWERKQ